MSPRLRVCALIVLVLLGGGCATYTDKVGKVYQAADAGDYPAGIDRLNKLLDVESSEQLPDKWTATRSLAVLERAVLLQATGQYKESARDLSAAESELELLDLKSDPAGTIGKYVYSDSAQAYKTPPTERLALSALNMVNYLAAGDLQGAGVEARRFTVSRNYLESLDKTVHGAFGSYLAGFVFEKLGEPERALRYYEEALEAGDLETLRGPIQELSQRAAYRGPKLSQYLNAVQTSGADTGERVAASAEADGEILLVLGLGRVPYKVPQRIPVGAALGIAGTNVSGDPKVFAALALKVIVYPELVTPDNLVTDAAVNVDGRSVPVDKVTDLGNEVAREYESLKPQIIASALTRMLARAGAAEGARQATKKADESTRWLAALATEAALLGLDKPDTRSWTFLPAHVCLCRTRVPPGPHDVHIELQGRTRENRAIQVNVPPGGFCVAAIMEPR